MNYRALLFDLDGTLVDSTRLIFGAFNHVAERFLGRRYAPEEITPFFGPSEESTWVRLLPPEQLQEGLKTYYTYYREHHHLVTLYEGILQLLQRLQQREAPMAIVTGRGRRTTEITLELSRLGPLFSTVVTSDDLSHPKPHPECIRVACERLQVPPGESLIIGDSPLDIEAGQAAGAATAAAFWGTFGLGGSLEKARADFSFRTPRELERFLCPD